MGLWLAQSLSSTTPILKLNTHQGTVFTNATEYNELSLALGIFVHGENCSKANECWIA